MTNKKIIVARIGGDNVRRGQVLSKVLGCSFKTFHFQSNEEMNWAEGKCLPIVDLPKEICINCGKEVPTGQVGVCSVKCGIEAIEYAEGC